MFFIWYTGCAACDWRWSASGAAVSVCGIPEKNCRWMSESGMPGRARYHVQTGAGAQTSRSVQDSGCAPARHSAPDLCERDVFAALAGMGSCLVLNVLLQLLFPLSDGWDSTREAVYGTSIALQLLVTVVLAPLTEELLFRGLIRAELRTHMKPRTAAPYGRPVVWHVPW